MSHDVQKIDGTTEPFDETKLEASLIRSGAGSHIARHITNTIKQTLLPNIGTEEIYRRAFLMLKRTSRPLAARYSLRRALFELGPSGHPFEDFVAALFHAEGWNIETRKIIQGKCVPHEVDMYASRGNEHIAAEIKYHNDPRLKTDVKVALYVKARFDDIWQCDNAQEQCPIERGMLITNTKFTSSAIQYAKCSGLFLMGWSYPEEGNLYDRIIASGVYPISTITSLQKSEKRLLIDRGITNTKTLLLQRDALREMRIPPVRIGVIISEIETLAQM